MGIFIEPGIEPLVNAINNLGFLRTIYSCEGHFDREPNEKFIPTAYVTFKTADLEKFRHIYNEICALNTLLVSAYLRMTYDCVFGLYTLSIWPDTSIISVSERRATADAAVLRLADIISNYAKKPISILTRREGEQSCTVHPCGESHAACMLVIPQEDIICPFAGILD